MVACFELYFRNVWNVLDVFGLLMFVVGFQYRTYRIDEYDHSDHTGEAYHEECPLLLTSTFTWVANMQAFYCMSFFTLCLKTLSLYTVTRSMGPLVIQIQTMIVDLFLFMFVLSVFIIGYGVICTSLKFPNDNRPDEVVTNVLMNPYWQVYGELFLDSFQKDEECIHIESFADLHNLQSNQTRCPQSENVLPGLSAIYMLLANILLLNLLIALFASTYEKINQESDKYWKFQRAELVMEYKDKPPFPFPTMFLYHLNYIYKSIIYPKFFASCAMDGFVGDFDAPQMKELQVLERVAAMDVIKEEKPVEDVETDMVLRNLNSLDWEAVGEKIDTLVRLSGSTQYDVKHLKVKAKEHDHLFVRFDGSDRQLTRIEEHAHSTRVVIDDIQHTGDTIHGLEDHLIEKIDLEIARQKEVENARQDEYRQDLRQRLEYEEFKQKQLLEFREKDENRRLNEHNDRVKNERSERDTWLNAVQKHWETDFRRQELADRQAWLDKVRSEFQSVRNEEIEKQNDWLERIQVAYREFEARQQRDRENFQVYMDRILRDSKFKPDEIDFRQFFPKEILDFKAPRLDTSRIIQEFKSHPSMVIRQEEKSKKEPDPYEPNYKHLERKASIAAQEACASLSTQIDIMKKEVERKEIIAKLEKMDTIISSLKISSQIDDYPPRKSIDRSESTKPLAGFTVIESKDEKSRCPSTCELEESINFSGEKVTENLPAKELGINTAKERRKKFKLPKIQVTGPDSSFSVKTSMDLGSPVETSTRIDKDEREEEEQERYMARIEWVSKLNQALNHDSHNTRSEGIKHWSQSLDNLTRSERENWITEVKDIWFDQRIEEERSMLASLESLEQTSTRKLLRMNNLKNRIEWLSSSQSEWSVLNLTDTQKLLWLKEKQKRLSVKRDTISPKLKGGIEFYIPMTVDRERGKLKSGRKSVSMPDLQYLSVEKPQTPLKKAIKKAAKLKNKSLDGSTSTVKPSSDDTTTSTVCEKDSSKSSGSSSKSKKSGLKALRKRVKSMLTRHTVDSCTTSEAEDTSLPLSDKTDTRSKTVIDRRKTFSRSKTKASEPEEKEFLSETGK